MRLYESIYIYICVYVCIYIYIYEMVHTEEPGMLQSMGSQRIGHNVGTEQHQNIRVPPSFSFDSFQEAMWYCGESAD